MKTVKKRSYKKKVWFYLKSNKSVKNQFLTGKNGGQLWKK